VKSNQRAWIPVSLFGLRHVQGGELVAADAACVPDGALSGDIQCFDVDQDAVAHRKTLED